MKTKNKIQQYLDAFSYDSPQQAGISLEKTVEHLFASPVAGIGMHQFVYTFDMSTQTIDRIQGIRKLLGYDESSFDFQTFHANIHPDDLDKMMNATLEATQHIIENQETFPLAAQLNTTYRIRRVDGTYLHIQDSVYCLSVDADAMPIKGICIGTNISPVPFIDVTAHLSCPCNQFTTFNSLKKKSMDFNFTKREQEIMKYIGEGKSSEAIAKQLFISRYTVDKHRSNLLKKAGVQRTQELIRFFVHAPPNFE